MTDPNFLNPITILADIGGISIDILKRRSVTYPNIVTDNPIEDGSPTTDHITNLPPIISLEGGFSDVRISNLVGPAVTQQAIKGLSKTQFDKLVELNLTKDVFTVMDGLHLYKDVVFESLTETKEREGFTVFFTAELKVIRKVSLDQSSAAAISNATDSLNRLKLAPQLLLSVGAISTKTSLESIGILA